MNEEQRPRWTVAKCFWTDSLYALSRDDATICRHADPTFLLGMADALNTGGQESAAQSALAILSASLGSPVVDDRGITREEAIVRYALAKIADLTRQCQSMDELRESVQSVLGRQAALASSVEAADRVIAEKDAALISLRAQFQGLAGDRSQEFHDLVNDALLAGQPYER